MRLVTPDAAASTTDLVVVLIVCGVVGIGLYIWYALALSRLFPKLGSPARKGGIPIVNDAEIFVLGGAPAWSVALAFISVVNIYALILRIKATGLINAAFGKGRGMTTLAVLFPPLWATVLAVSNPLPIAGRMPPTTARPPLPPGTRMLSPMPTPLGSAPEVEPPSTTSRPVLSTPTSQRLGPISPYLHPESQQGAEVGRSAPATSAAAAKVDATSPWERAPSRAGFGEAESPAPAAPNRAVVITAPHVRPTGPLDPSPSGPKTLVPSAFDIGRAANEDPDDEDPDDEAAEERGEGEGGETIVVNRRPATPWRLAVEGVGEFPLVGERALLGTEPKGMTGTLALKIPDTTRTVSKSHARFDLVGDQWVITDLDSTNGVYITAVDGTERLLEAGEVAAIPCSFILVKLTMSISYESLSP